MFPTLRCLHLHTRHLLAVGTLAAAPVVSGGQQPLERVSIEAGTSRTVRNNEQADRLEARAVILYGIPGKWRTAAQLHRRAGELREDDPRAVQSFRLASWAYSAARDQGTARVMMERAAERAAAGGDVERAASSYVDAALIAATDERYDVVPGLLRKTKAMLASPLLASDRRAMLLERIEGTPRLAQAWTTP